MSFMFVLLHSYHHVFINEHIPIQFYVHMLKLYSEYIMSRFDAVAILHTHTVPSGVGCNMGLS